MVQTINKSVCRGVAGRRVGKVKGIVIHNDAGSVYATAKHYLTALGTMTNTQLANGFAHYYIDRNTIVRVEDTYNQAWHTANSDGNSNYIGYEVCQSIGANEKDFLANEQVVFKQAAEDLKFYGLPADRNTVRLHKEFVATACPHRSWELHGKSVNAVKDYFIAEIKKYMSGSATTQTHLVWLYAKSPLGLREKADWNSKTVAVVPESYAAQLDLNDRKNGFVRVHFRGKKYWYKESTDHYWDKKRTGNDYITTDNVNFRADSNWMSKVVTKANKNAVIRVVGRASNGWLKCVLNDRVGFIPDNTAYVRKK